MAAALSIVAIGISAITLGWTIFWSVFTHRRATRAQVTVKLSFSVPVYGYGLGEAAMDVTATNTGSVPVTLTSVLFGIRGHDETVAVLEWIVATPQQLPIVLEPGRHWTGMVSAANILDGLDRQYGQREKWRLRALVGDSSSKRYASPWVGFDRGAVSVFQR